MILAKLEYDKVIEILNDQLEIPTIESPYQYIDITGLSSQPIVGMIYIGDGIFINKSKRYSKLEWRNKFSTSEKIAFDSFELNPNIPDENKAVLRTLTKDLDLTEYVDASRADTINGTYFLAVCGIITMQKATEVLA